MPKPSADDAAPQNLAPEVFDLTVEEWCGTKSQTQVSPELLGAFYASEVREGRSKDTARAFEDRFEAFTNRPA